MFMQLRRQVLIKRRSRVLQRRTRQAALDKPRVHDGQLGFCYTKALKSETLENRAFEEKQPSVFYRNIQKHGITLTFQ